MARVKPFLLSAILITPIFLNSCIPPAAVAQNTLTPNQIPQQAPIKVISPTSTNQPQVAQQPATQVAVKKSYKGLNFTAGVPHLTAKAAIVIDVNTGQILTSKNADTQRAVASTQKLLTALVTLEAGSIEDPVIVQLTDTQVEPIKLYLRVGETYSRADLLTALLVRSGNDAARSLARDVAGSNVGFAARMNHKAAQLGMTRSHFKNPSGLTVEGQYSTARDMAKLAVAAYRNPFIRQCVQIKKLEFKRPQRNSLWLSNTNQLLKRLPFVNGMKTGTTKASGKCLISSASHQGRTVIAVVLGSTPAEVWKDSEKLLRWSLDLPETSP